jgi:hypothetical protein
LLSRFPKAAIVNTFNLRKKDLKRGTTDLLSDPRDWLEEVCGSLDICNRSDVRLGIDERNGKKEVRVINGIVRGREMDPILIRSAVTADDKLAGFEQVIPDALDLLAALSNVQRTYWLKLPQEFKFDEVADKLVPRSSLFRLIRAASRLGALSRAEDGSYRKPV